MDQVKSGVKMPKFKLSFQIISNVNEINSLHFPMMKFTRNMYHCHLFHIPKFHVATGCPKEVISVLPIFCIRSYEAVVSAISFPAYPLANHFPIL